MQAILLAGGRGTRLLPYTTVFPKPLVPVGDQPISEIVVRQLAAAGFDRIVFAVSHLAGLIEAYFGDGGKWGVRISYSLEDTPLGTAGPIGLVRDLDSDFLVMNGDVLTDLDFRALVADHRQRGAIATITTARKQVPISLGVVTMDDQQRLLEYDEKPTLHYLISTGIYVLNRRIQESLIPPRRVDLPDLMRDLIARGERVHCHTHEGEWLDIGRPEDYEEALSRYAADPGRFVPPARG
jgi:NDP-sugar pyrophosphorylase family protein